MNRKTYDEVLKAASNNNLNELKIGLKKAGLVKDSKKFFLKDIYYYFKNLGRSSIQKDLFLEDTQDLLRSIFTSALNNNNSEMYKYIIESDELKINLDLNLYNIWGAAIYHSKLDVIQYLVSVDKGNKKAEAITYCLSRHTRCPNIVPYLIDDTSMPLHDSLNKFLKENGDYYTRTNQYKILNVCNVFIKACGLGNKEVIDYLLQHQTYGNLIDSFSFFEGIKDACNANELKLMDYLLNDNNMPFKPYESYDPKRLLQIAARKQNVDIINYLVMDFGIQKPDIFSFDTCVVAQHVVSFKDQDEIDKYNKVIEDLYKLFEKRELHDGLQNDLKPNFNTHKVKNKI